jgi:hypothetical protein
MVSRPLYSFSSLVISAAMSWNAASCTTVVLIGVYV